ncbi:MAG TPA: glycoside hydrolase family 16 protein [Acidimicrobiales bacterium]|nr:glycoside hydrolase family 16 protein [Acidimicrobiales bacterium]
MTFSKMGARLRLVRAHTRSWGRQLAVAATVMAIVAPLVVQGPAVASARRPPVTVADVVGPYPVGLPDSTEPSGMGPPTATALVGYAQSYVADFAGTTLPPGWDVFTGVPGGDPGGHFGISHVVVNGGELELTTYRDPAWHNRWVTGGLCQCGLAHTYGAYFVRSRITAPGPNEAELLWPAGKVWPPEIDFNETGGTTASTSDSVHFGKANTIVRSHIFIDMTLWHTWGVIWTPKYILFTVDGSVWGSFRVVSEISRAKMTLDFEQRQICVEHRQCPTAPTSMLIDWVAEYART